MLSSKPHHQSPDPLPLSITTMSNIRANLIAKEKHCCLGIIPPTDHVIPTQCEMVVMVSPFPETPPSDSCIASIHVLGGPVVASSLLSVISKVSWSQCIKRWIPVRWLVEIKSSDQILPHSALMMELKELNLPLHDRRAWGCRFSLNPHFYQQIGLPAQWSCGRSVSHTPLMW